MHSILFYAGFFPSRTDFNSHMGADFSLLWWNLWFLTKLGNWKAVGSSSLIQQCAVFKDTHWLDARPPSNVTDRVALQLVYEAPAIISSPFHQSRLVLLGLSWVLVVCFHSITQISAGAGALEVLWSGEFVSFHTGIQQHGLVSVKDPGVPGGRIWGLSVHWVPLLCLPLVLLALLADDLYVRAMKFLWHWRLICGLAGLICTAKFTIWEDKCCPLCLVGCH